VGIDKKLNNCLKIRGLINHKFRAQKTPKKTRIKLYNTLALPVLLYSSDNWTITSRETSRITAAEMKCMRKNSRIHLDRLENIHRDCKRIKYNPSFGKKYTTTEEIGYDM
jgi:hypothetical protein